MPAPTNIGQTPLSLADDNPVISLAAPLCVTHPYVSTGSLTPAEAIVPLRFIRRFALLLCLVLCAQPCAFALSSGDTPPAAASIGAQLTKRGVGHGVKLVRADGSEIKGRIVSLRNDSVDLQTKGSTQVSTVSYAEVAKVKGPGLSTGAKVGIGVGIGVVVCVAVAAIVINHEISKPWNF